MRGVETTGRNIPLETWWLRLIRQLRFSVTKLDNRVDQEIANDVNQEFQNEAHVQPLLPD
jgi:hypothetical protein